MNCNKNSELKTNSLRHICESKLGRGDFLVRVDEYLKKSVRVKIEVNPQPSYAHLLPSLGEGKTSHADIKGMTSFDHSRHCERSEAIQEEMVSNRLLRRFTPRNDSNSSENKKKAGIK